MTRIMSGKNDREKLISLYNIEHILKRIDKFYARLEYVEYLERRIEYLESLTTQINAEKAEKNTNN